VRTITIQVPKEGASVELMLVGDAIQGEATLTLPDGVIVRPPPLRYDLPGDVILEPHRYGWSADLGSMSASFCGHPISLRIDTSDQPPTDTPPAPSRAELNLATTILRNLPSLLATCETAFAEEGRKYDATAQQHVLDPHIWISREFIEDGSRWSLSVSRDDAPDFGYRLEFDGLKYLGISAGD
jgi:hypothetical protein